MSQAEGARLKGTKSKYARDARDAKATGGLKALKSLEKREEVSLAAAEANVRATVVRCFNCLDCKRTFETRPVGCRDRGHDVRAATATKRLFVCGSCGTQKHSIERRPRGPCAKCHVDSWKVAKVEDAKKVAKDLHEFRPALAEWTSRADVLSIVDI